MKIEIRTAYRKFKYDPAARSSASCRVAIEFTRFSPFARRSSRAARPLEMIACRSRAVAQNT